MLLVAVCVLTVTLGVLAGALRKVASGSSAEELVGSLRSVAGASADLDGAVEEFRGRVAERGGR